MNDAGIISIDLEDCDLIRKVFDTITKSDRWLMIFDNVQDWRLIQEFFPANGSGDIIFTSTRSSSGELDIRGIEIREMPEKEAREFFIRRSRLDIWDDGNLDELLQTLGFLPLAIECAAAAIEESKGNLSIRQYLVLYNESASNRKALLGEKRNTLTLYEETVIGAYDITFKQILENQPIPLRYDASEYPVSHSVSV